jgi:hypothetical protein
LRQVLALWQVKQKPRPGVAIPYHYNNTLTMSTAIVAGRLIELCKEGKFLEAQHELYDTAIISIDPDGSKTVGALNMHAKEEQFLARLEKLHSINWSEPLIAGSYFTVILKMEIEFKKFGNKSLEEVCVYQVRNDKIVFEQFFRDL